MTTPDSSLHIFVLRWMECLGLLVLGWWLGSLSAANLSRPQERGVNPATAFATPSPANETLGRISGSLGRMPSSDKSPATGHAGESYAEWVLVPTALVTESDGDSFLGVLNAVTPVDAQNKTMPWKDRLRLTPRQHERLAEILRRTLAEWARLQIADIQRSEEYPEIWRLRGNSGSLKALDQRMQTELRHAVGPEKAGLFNALAYQEIGQLFHDSSHAATFDSDGNFSLLSRTKTGARTTFFGREALGAAAVIAAEVKRRQGLQPPAVFELKP